MNTIISSRLRRTFAISFSVFAIFTFCFATFTALIATSTIVRGQGRANAISGRVMSDSGQALPSAAIHVAGIASTNAGARTTSTDETGRFTVNNLDAGAYTVSAYVPGYVPVRNPPGIEADSFYRRPGDNVTLTLRRGGVITGKVTNALGEPVVKVAVRATRIRDEENRPVTSTFFNRDRQTDDRGIYRLYGLEPGTYVVSAGGRGQNYFGLPGGYDTDAPTYHPSASRDGAAEIVVRSGAEASGADIRYRGEPGSTISGKLTGAVASGERNYDGISVTLNNATTGTPEAFTYVDSGGGNERAFTLTGVPDGDYDLTARRGYGNATGAAATPRRINVRGANIAGIELALAPLGSLGGTLRIEPRFMATGEGESCHGREDIRVTPEEVVLIARRQEEEKNEPRSNVTSEDDIPALDGRFMLRNLEVGGYRLDVRPPGDDLYIRSITASAPATKRRTAAQPPPPASEFTIKSGESVSGIAVTLAAGAARLQGSVVPAVEGAPLPARLRIYLVPAETEHTEHGWRYRTTLVETDRSWTLHNIAPGAYRLLALPADAELRARHSRTLNADAKGRTELRRRAEASGEHVKFAPCARIADYVLRYAPAVNEDE